MVGWGRGGVEVWNKVGIVGGEGVEGGCNTGNS